MNRPPIFANSSYALMMVRNASPPPIIIQLLEGVRIDACAAALYGDQDGKQM